METNEDVMKVYNDLCSKFTNYLNIKNEEIIDFSDVLNDISKVLLNI